MITAEQVKNLYGNKETYITKDNMIVGNLTCPHCHKPKAYINLKKSTFMFCNRMSCIHYFTKKQGYNVFNDLKIPVKVLKQPFDVFLASRGLDYSKIDYGFICKTNEIYFVLENGSRQKRNISTKHYKNQGSTHDTYYSALLNDNTDLLIVVESIFCSLTLKQCGYNAIACLGASMRLSQNSTILELCRKYKLVAFILDHDDAGLAFIIENYDILMANQINFQAYTLNNYHDVNDIIIKGGDVRYELKHEVTLCASNKGFNHDL